MRLNPYHPEWYWVDLGSVFYAAKRYEDAIEAFKKRLRPQAWVLSRLALAMRRWVGWKKRQKLPLKS